MRRIVALCALFLVACQLSAQNFTEFKAMKAKGLPANAMPAKFYFQHRYDNPGGHQFTMADMEESSVVTPYNTETTDERQHYIFVVEQPTAADQDLTFIDVWACVNDGKPYRAFHQSASNFGEDEFLDVHLLADVISRDSTYTDKKTRQRITRHLKDGAPVAAFTVQDNNGTIHGLISTVLLQCQSGNTQLLKGEKPVEVLMPLVNMLMTPEWNMVQNYLVTTSSGVLTTDSYEPNDDFVIFNHIKFTPVLHIYTPKGRHLHSFELPTDELDMIR